MTDDELSKDLEEAYRAGDKIPAGWAPYTEQTDQIGKAIVRLPRPDASARDLLIGAGFNPDDWQIKGSINARKWMSYDGRWLHYYRFEVVAGESPEVVQAHIDDLVKLIRKRSRPAAPKFTGASDAWLFLASDWQIGKAEGANGTDQTIQRVLESVDMAKQQVKDLRRIGRRMPHGAIAGLGDLVEGCAGFYPNQPFVVDRNRRDQGRIVRELITHTIDELSPLFDAFTVLTVGGNHGQNRQDGKLATDHADNDDVAAFEAVKEAFDRAGQTGIDWVVPQDERALKVELGGVEVAFTHGDLFRAGATPAQKAEKWWSGQEFGFRDIYGARILNSGHFHHLLCNTFGLRTAFQTPAMDPGSRWWDDSTGQHSPAGTLTYRLDATEPLGWDDVKVLSPSRP